MQTSFVIRGLNDRKSKTQYKGHKNALILLRPGGVKEDKNIHENQAHSLYNAKCHKNAGIQRTQIQRCFCYSYVIHIAAEVYLNTENFLFSQVWKSGLITTFAIKLNT